MTPWLLVAPLLALDTPPAVAVGPQAAEPVRFAAAELSRYIEAASGLAVRTAAEAALRDAPALALVVDGFPGAAALHAPVSPNDEAYRIHSLTGGGRAFTGNSPRAVLYAVYDFLEAELEYRWYFPYPEDAVTPSLSPAALRARLAAPVDRETRPAYAFREREFRDVMPSTAATDDLIVHQIDWWAKLRMNRFLLNFHYPGDASRWERWRTRLIPEIKRRGLLVGLGEHGSYPLFLPPSRYAAAYPEWYCEIDGERIGGMRTTAGEWAQFCTTNPAAVAAYLENFAAFVRRHPEIDFYYPAPNDVGRWCECARCRELSVADRYLRLNNRIAERLNQVRPGTRIMHLAYSNHRLPPEATRPHSMIDIDVACWGRDFSFPLCDPRTMHDDPDYLAVFRRWDAICRQQPGRGAPRLLYHWKIMRHYWLGLHLLPLPILSDDFGCIATLGLDGFDLPLGYLGIWTKALNTSVVANMMWDPDCSPATLTERFMADCYGPHAATAHTVYRLVAEAFRDCHYGSSLTLAWHPDTSEVRDSPLEGLGESARHAVDRLEHALALTESLTAAPPSVTARVRKLHTVVRHARDEQRVLEKVATLMDAANRVTEEGSDDARQAALRAWEAATAANDALAAAYSLEDDEAGLYWGGASYRQLRDALGEWRIVVEGLTWQVVGHWTREDFNDGVTPITKHIDVTAALAGALPGAVAARFRYTGGEIGASLRAASLWRQDPDGTRALLAEERHNGFAGYIHENADYRLQVTAPPAPNARYVLSVELAAGAAAVARRGCRGDILIGLPCP